MSDNRHKVAFLLNWNLLALSLHHNCAIVMMSFLEQKDGKPKTKDFVILFLYFYSKENVKKIHVLK